MTTRDRVFTATLTSALALVPMTGCFGPSNDKGDVSPSSANPAGTARPNLGEDSQTGGLGGTRDPENPPGPGGTGPRTGSGDNTGPK